MNLDEVVEKKEFISDKGKVIPGILANIISRDIKYKNYLNADFKYNGYYYEKITQLEEIQKLIKDYIPVEKQTVRIINETLNLMRIENTIRVADVNKYISVNNGVINLDTLKLEPHSPEKITFYKVDCEFTKDSTNNDKLFNSRFYQYLKTTFEDDTETVLFISQLLGITLKPNPKLFKKSIFLLGEGNNGKSVFLNIIEKLQGNIFSAVPFKAIDSDKFQLYNMIGVNVNIDDDASGTRLTETSNYKKITTGGAVSIEGKNRQATPGFLEILLIIALNKMPSTSDKSWGFYRRNLILPFNKTFVSKEEFNNKPDTLIADDTLEYDILNKEMDIVLAFALKGLKRVLDTNYHVVVPKIVENATKEYRLDTDTVLAFYEDNKNGQYIYPTVTANNLYAKYEEWCNENENGDNLVPQKTFGAEIKKYIEFKMSNGVKYLNVKLNSQI